MKNVFLALSNPTSEEAAACDRDMWQVWSAATVLSVKCCRIRREKIREQNTPTVWKLKQCQINYHWQTSARNHHDHRVQPPSVPKHSHTHACMHIRTHTEGRQGGERQERVPGPHGGLPLYSENAHTTQLCIETGCHGYGVNCTAKGITLPAREKEKWGGGTFTV